MIFKLRTSSDTMKIFERIGQKTNLQPYVLSKIAIALSVASNTDLNLADFNTSSDGLELNRQTITGDHDALFKAVIINNLGYKLTEEEYFPKMVKAHLDRGALMLENEFRYSKNFLEHLCKLEEGI